MVRLSKVLVKQEGSLRVSRDYRDAEEALAVLDRERRDFLRAGWREVELGGGALPIGGVALEMDGTYVVLEVWHVES